MQIRFLGAVAVVFTAGSAFADDGFVYATDGFSADLVQINTADGSSTVIGHMPNLDYGVGLAFNPNTNTLYARDFDTLVTVDPNTGNTSVIGPSGSFITSLAFSNDYSTLYSFDQSTGDFYHVDPATGSATLVGNTGISSPLDMSVDSGGTLWAADISANIYKIDPSNGSSSFVWGNVTNGEGLTSIEFSPSGSLYGVTLNSDLFVSIDLGNGTSSVIGGPVIRSDIRGMAFNRVPAPGVGALLGLAGLAAGRRRR